MCDERHGVPGLDSRLCVGTRLISRQGMEEKKDLPISTSILQ